MSQTTPDLAAALNAAAAHIDLPDDVAGMLARLDELAAQRRAYIDAAGAADRFAVHKGPKRPPTTGDPKVDGPALEQWHKAVVEYREGMRANNATGHTLRGHLRRWATDAGDNWLTATLRPAVDELAAQAAPRLELLAAAGLHPASPEPIARRGGAKQLAAYRELRDLDDTYAVLRAAWVEVTKRSAMRTADQRNRYHAVARIPAQIWDAAGWPALAAETPAA